MTDHITSSKAPNTSDDRPSILRRILGPVVLDGATIYLFVGLAVALLVVAVAGSQRIAETLMVLGVIALPFVVLGGVIYLAVKHGVRNGRSGS